MLHFPGGGVKLLLRDRTDFSIEKHYSMEEYNSTIQEVESEYFPLSTKNKAKIKIGDWKNYPLV